MFCLFCVAALAYLLMQWARERHDRVLFRHETFHDLDDFSLSLLKRHTAFREKREQVGLDRWAGDIKRKHREGGFFAAAASVLVDGVTLGGTARKRLIREEFELLSAIALRTDEGFRKAEENIRLCVKVTGPRLRHGIRLLRKSQRMTRSVGCANTPNVSPRVQQQATQVALRRDSFIGSSNDFVAIATSAGAGASTAIGLWGAVQLAGHASTSAAMAGLYGAAAHNAGWAWFGGGSLASGGGGMALGHVLLPGVGVAVALGTLSYQFHRQANDMERAVAQGEKWIEESLPVLDSLMGVEERYRRGSQRLRDELEILHGVVALAENRLRRFGMLSDLRRNLRVRRGGTLYTNRETPVVEELVRANARFLQSMPDVQHGYEA